MNYSIKTYYSHNMFTTIHKLEKHDHHEEFLIIVTMSIPSHYSSWKTPPCFVQVLNAPTQLPHAHVVGVVVVRAVRSHGLRLKEVGYIF